MWTYILSAPNHSLVLNHSPSLYTNLTSYITYKYNNIIIDYITYLCGLIFKCTCKIDQGIEIFCFDNSFLFIARLSISILGFEEEQFSYGVIIQLLISIRCRCSRMYVFNPFNTKATMSKETITQRFLKITSEPCQVGNHW